MTTPADSRSVLHVPPRDVPIPASISPEAQAALAAGPILPDRDWPPTDDTEAWRAALEEIDDFVVKMIESAAGTSAGAAELFGRRVEDRDINGVPVYVVTRPDIATDDRRVYLDIHGGGFVQGGGLACRITAAALAPPKDPRIWSVDYRMPPDFPFPAGLDDCLTTSHGT